MSVSSSSSLASTGELLEFFKSNNIQNATSIDSLDFMKTIESLLSPQNQSDPTEMRKVEK